MNLVSAIHQASSRVEENNKRRAKLSAIPVARPSTLSEEVISSSRKASVRGDTAIDVLRSNTLFVSATRQEHKYQPSPVGSSPIYPVAPVELLEPDISTSVDIDKKDLLVYYFETLYPLTRSSKKWRKMSLESLQRYYDSMQFWYTFNTSWTSSPMPVTLSNSVYKNWEKCTFFQANTVVQSAITSWGLGWRNNNSPQDNVKSSLTYINKDGSKKTINTVTTDKDYWDVACGTKMEITSWGWNPYPFGIYAQGPFMGTGNFLQIPNQGIGGAIVGTSHWDIILKCKADDARDSAVWSSIFNHEIHDTNMSINDPPSLVYSQDEIDVTPLIVINDQRTNEYYWSGILGKDMDGNSKGGYTPLLIAYFLWYVGGFGGIGGDAPFDTTWYTTNYMYTPLYVITSDGKLTFPEDQSIPSSARLPGGFNRQSNDFWVYFSKFFALIQAWDTDWSIQKWRHPVMKTYWYTNGTKNYYLNSVGPSCNNPSDSLMMAYTTGNFQIIKWSAWLTPGTSTTLGSGPGDINPALSKFSKNPATWSHYQTTDGKILPSGMGKDDGFPVGVMTNKGCGYNFVIRTQMPNVNYDICAEFADFRVTTPGQLSTGVGDQSTWKEMFTVYAKRYMFTADPDNTDLSHSFTDEFAIRLPDTELQTSSPVIGDWKIANNVASGKTFFGFDVLSGIWDSNPYIAGIKDGKSSLLPQDSGTVPSYECTVYLYPIKGAVACTESVGSSFTPSARKDVIADLAGGAVTDPVYTTNSLCDPLPYDSTSGYAPITNAPTGTKYWPSPGDSFAKGVVGFQANGTIAQLGSSQTRWIMSSKGIAWDYSAPLSNRLQLLRGAKNLHNSVGAASNAASPTARPERSAGNNTLLVTSILVIVVVALVSTVLYFKRASLTQTARRVVFSTLTITGIMGIILLVAAIIGKNNNDLRDDFVGDEAHRLRTYFALIYPMVPVSRWNDMSLEELRTFFCSLHWWYKGDGLPSPKDYLNTKYWVESVPFGKGSLWKPFCLRKNCVVNVSPPAYNETDGKLCVGYDKSIVHTSANDSPSAIIWNGRQLQSLGAQFQQTTFFQPSQNYHVDTYNNFPTVNDTGLDEWKKVRYVEVSSQWGPFPDGIYHDWAPGTGVWLDLDKHAVGYTGLDLVRRLGIEAMQNKVDLNPIYQEAWQKTGLSTMALSSEGQLTLPDINWPDFHAGFGWYGTVILSVAQTQQIASLAKTNKASWSNSDESLCANGALFKKIAKYVTPQYLVEGSDGKWSWSNSKPDTGSYVDGYPLPLPYFTTFKGNNKGLPQTNTLALRMPWKYQLFNICRIMRGFCIDLLFLDDGVVNTSTLKGLEYVDWLKANEKNPLRNARTWEVAIDTCNTLMSTPLAHPIFLRYPRIYDSNSNEGDGPQFMLSQDLPNLTSRETLMSTPRAHSVFLRYPRIYDSNSTGGDGPQFMLSQDLPNLTLREIQLGALDTDKYPQTVDRNGGATYGGQTSLPQSSSATLEIDHWLPMLGRPIGYKTCVRIQHWCGNKSLSLDIEIINISQPISGNLVSNMPTDNMYEVWEKGGRECLSVRDPFADDSHVYSNDGPVHDIRQKFLPQSPKSEGATWTPPPWIEYTPNANMKDGESNVYGWPAELIGNFMTTHRLSYCPANAQQVTLSGSYPEYNKVIFENMVKSRTLLGR
jgi:hypothetical protein